MNKKLLGLIAALAVTTGAQADTFMVPAIPDNIVSALYNANQQHPAFAQADIIAATAAYDAKGRLITNAIEQAQFERKVQAGTLAFMGAALTTAIICMVKEWHAEFKVRKAEKAKLIARLEADARQIKATA